MTSLQAITAIYYAKGILLCGTKMGNICLFSEDTSRKSEILPLPKSNDYITCFSESTTGDDVLYSGSNTG